MGNRAWWKKRIWITLLMMVLCYVLFSELGGVVLFFAGVFGLTALWMFGRSWWRKRRDRRRREEETSARERAEEAALNRRREAFRKVRYTSEERRRVEACIRQSLGPIADWDLGEGGEGPAIDVALVPPTEELPFWKAVTVGAGACILEAGGGQTVSQRAELVLALPPDWDAAQDWPGRALRGVAWNGLVTMGFIGYAVYRSLSLTAAGFAGAVMDLSFSGLPELPCAVRPEGEGVCFCWTVPLLKPELDYLRRRGYENLDRRLPAARPWADPRRKPWADGNWFQEDIAPFVWSEYGGRVCLGLEAGRFYQELFLRAGLRGGGEDWEELSREYLRHYQPEDGPFVEYACDERTFFAVSEDREILERLALGLADLLRDDRVGAWRLLAPEGRR